MVKASIPTSANHYGIEASHRFNPKFTLAAIITKTSVENMNLMIGQPAYAMIKSSDVMVAVD